MKTNISLALFSFVFLFSTPAAQATDPYILISEVAIEGAKTTDDFVELYNPGSTCIDISGYRLRYKNSSGKEDSLREIEAKTYLPSESYFLWANDDGIFSSIADTKKKQGLSKHYSLALFLPEKSGGAIIDSVSWETLYPFNGDWFSFATSPGKNESLVRDLVTGNWITDFSNSPTPISCGDACKQPCPSPQPDPDPLPDIPPADPSASSVRLNEVFPNPKAKSDAGEFVELYNAGSEPVDISGWTLRDATKTGKYTFPSETIIDAESYFVVTDQSFKLSLNNSDETISLYDKNDALVDSMRYAKTKDDISLNFTPTGWRGGTPTPGAANILNNLPSTKEKVPKKGYRGMPIIMSAKGKDADRDTLKHTWDFGDGHKSYKAETKHTYEANGEYTVTLTTSDGKDDVVETFQIKIEKYEAPDIRITSFVPNPDGNDSDSEWILIENREKKHEVDLLGFGIATGWKKLANHPVRQSFIIPPKSEARLTREYSLFTLPNQKGKIELRAPDGSVIQDIKYKLEKSAPEDAVYMKKKGERWTLGPAPKKIAATKPSSAVAGAATETPEVNAGVPDAAPIPTPAPLPEEETLHPAVTRNDLLTEDPDRPRLSDLLSYGLSLHLPRAIAYVPHDTIPVTQAIPEPAQDKADNLFTRINIALNAWLNEI